MRRAGLVAVLMLALLGGLAVLALGVPWSSGTGSASPTNLACSVKPFCGAGEVQVFRLSSISNAHAGTAAGSSYANVVCCGGVTGIITACSGVHDIVIGLSGADDAHVASDASYTTQVCLSVGAEGTADCLYGPSCDPGYACLATISGSTNAHVADCNSLDHYGTKICCKAAPDNCPAVPNPGQENTDGDDWGDACDYCPTTPTPWYAPAGDDDCDGFTTAREEYLPTDPLDACPDVLGTPGLCPGPSCDGDDAWPLDVDVDRFVSIADVLKFKGKLGKNFGDPDYVQRLDLNADGSVMISDVLVYKGNLGRRCTNP